MEEPESKCDPSLSTVTSNVQRGSSAILAVAASPRMLHVPGAESSLCVVDNRDASWWMTFIPVIRFSSPLPLSLLRPFFTSTCCHNVPEQVVPPLSFPTSVMGSFMLQPPLCPANILLWPFPLCTVREPCNWSLLDPPLPKNCNQPVETSQTADCPKVLQKWQLRFLLCCGRAAVVVELGLLSLLATSPAINQSASVPALGGKFWIYSERWEMAERSAFLCKELKRI